MRPHFQPETKLKVGRRSIFDTTHKSIILSYRHISIPLVNKPQPKISITVGHNKFLMAVKPNLSKQFGFSLILSAGKLSVV
jgi:hypothetical protein